MLVTAMALVLSPVAASASEPASEPLDVMRWMGTANGNSSLQLGHKASYEHKGKARGIRGSWAALRWASNARDKRELELEVRVDGQRVQISEPGTSHQWGGTYKAHGKGSNQLEVSYDEASMSALTEYVSDRVESLHRERDALGGGLQVSIVGYDVTVKVDRHRHTFGVKGKIRFETTHAGSDKPERGTFHFSGKGDAQEDPGDVPEDPKSIRVLLLGDLGSETQVENALRGAGHEVTTLARYLEWDGDTPDVTKFDVVVYLDGREFAEGLSVRADPTLAAFVADGGGLIRTEWSVWAGMVNPETDALMPLTYAGEFEYGLVWNVTVPGHALVANVPTSWTDINGYSHATPHPNATVVMESENGHPLLTYRDDTGGTVVHINHDLTFSSSVISPNALQLFVNAVEFAAPAPAAP
jgi:hypothetical protein